MPQGLRLCSGRDLPADLADLLVLRFGCIDDGTLQFGPGAAAPARQAGAAAFEPSPPA